MPQQRFRNLDPGKQAEILSAAFAEFSEKGYEGASLQRVIERTGLSRGMLYYYFEDKADLFVSVARKALEEFTGAIPLPDARSAGEFWVQMEKSMETLADTAMKNPEAVAIWKLVASVWDQGVPQTAMRELTGLWLEKMEKVGRTGLEAGAIRRDLPFSMLMSAVMGLRQGLDLWVTENWDRMSEEERRSLPMRAFSLARRIMEPQP